MINQRDIDNNRPDRTSNLWYLLGSIGLALFLGSCLFLVLINSTQGFPSAAGAVRYSIERKIIWKIDGTKQVNGIEILSGRPHLIIWLSKTDTSGHYFWKKLIDIPWHT